MLFFIILLAIVLSIVVLLATLGAIAYVAYSPNAMIRHIAKDDNGGIILVRDGEVVLEKNADKPYPLASVVKIIVMLEYARQAAVGTVDPNETVSQNDLEKFYLKNTDGGAHTSWRKSLLSDGSDQTPTLQQVVKGMMRYSSNANTMFLMNRLGIDNINDMIERLGLKHHEPLYPFVASVMVLGEHSKDELEAMKKWGFIRQSFELHEKMSKESATVQFDIASLGKDREQLFSDWFTQASARDYAKIMGLINGREFFSEAEYELIDQSINYDDGVKGINRGGEKSGSTRSLLTFALFDEREDGTRSEAVVLMQNLSPLQQLMFSLSQFGLRKNLVLGQKLPEYQQILNQ